MPVTTPDQQDKLLLLLYQLRGALKSLHVDVHSAYPSGSSEREAYALARLGVEDAIIDLENDALGSIAQQMQAATPDIKAATTDLKGKVDKFSQIAGAAEKAAKVLSIIEKVVKLAL